MDLVALGKFLSLLRVTNCVYTHSARLQLPMKQVTVAATMVTTINEGTIAGAQHPSSKDPLTNPSSLENPARDHVFPRYTVCPIIDDGNS